MGSRSLATAEQRLKGEGKAESAATAGIQRSCDDGKADEFVVPFVVTENGSRASIKDGDSVVFFVSA